MRVEDVAKYIGVSEKVVARVVRKDKNKKKNRMEFRSHPNIIIICYFIEQLVVARGFPRCKPNRIPDILAVRKSYLAIALAVGIFVFFVHNVKLKVKVSRGFTVTLSSQ